MIPRCNLHSHTVFSDGRDTPETLARVAIQRGLRALGFSDHSYVPGDVGCLSPESEPRYRAEIRRLQKKYAGQIELLLGCEHEAAGAPIDADAYDYFIESLHLLNAGGEWVVVDDDADGVDESVRRLFGGDPYAFCRAYYDALCRALSVTRAPIAGHLDLVAKTNEGGRLVDSADPRYRDAALQALRVAVERDLIVEVNTKAMARGLRSEPYPEIALLSQLRRWKGRVLLSSDCHEADAVDAGFETTTELLRSLGFAEIWVWEDGGLKPMAI